VTYDKTTIWYYPPAGYMAENEGFITVFYDEKGNHAGGSFFTFSDLEGAGWVLLGEL
jgi:hypothetical protein